VLLYVVCCVYFSPLLSCAALHSGVYHLEKALSHDDIKILINSEIRTQLINTVKVDTSEKYPPVKKIAEGSVLRILVTGGAGFVGSNLVDKLMMAGHNVVVVDNMFTGRQKNIIHWLGHPNFQLIIHDVVEPIMLEVDQIYHLACPASPPHYQVWRSTVYFSTAQYSGVLPHLILTLSPSLF
jgi:hypothetical protein